MALPKLGTITVRIHRPIPWQQAKTVTIKRMPSGKWYVCITVEVNVNERSKARDGRPVGVDMGVKNLVATSAGDYEDHPQFLRQSEN
ncbi:MAG: RNA-guided endonuclease TnpB family protein, partial [Anaerolineae bacterium]